MTAWTMRPATTDDLPQLCAGVSMAAQSRREPQCRNQGVPVDGLYLCHAHAHQRSLLQPAAPHRLTVADANVLARRLDDVANRATGAGMRRQNADIGTSCPSAHRETDAGAAEPSRVGVGPGTHEKEGTR